MLRRSRNLVVFERFGLHHADKRLLESVFALALIEPELELA